MLESSLTVHTCFLISYIVLLGFEFITSSYQQIDQPLKNYHQRRGEDNWDVIFDATWEGRSTCVSKNSLHCFTLIKIMVPRSETL